MITRYTHGDLVWIDLESPTQEEIRNVLEEFSIDPLVAEELLSPTSRPKADYFQKYIYLILHFPAIKQSHTTTNQEIDFIIGEKFVITTRYDTIDSLREFSKLFEVESILDRKDISGHGGFLFYYMIRKLYRASMNELEYVSDSISEIEDRMFRGEEREMVLYLSEVSKELLNFKRALAGHRNVLESLQIASDSLFKDFSYHAKTLIGEYFRVFNEVKSNAETVAELRETNNSLVSTKQNEIMKILTIMAFVTFPLSLVAGIFGMNTEHMPIVGNRFDFWLILGGMGTAALIFFIFFKHKKWL